VNWLGWLTVAAFVAFLGVGIARALVRFEGWLDRRDGNDR
jgi:hypothetical protein